MKRFLIWIMTLTLVFSMNFQVFAGGVSPADYDMALYIGSPLTVSGGIIKPLDSDNPNVAPIIYKDRTLVPLRAIAEHFGAVVSYDALNKAAVIKYNGITYTFFAGKNYYIQSVSGKADQTITYDTEMLIRESRSMVPLRVICEKILGKNVDYSKSIITVSSSPINLASNGALMEDIKSKIGQAVKISSLAQLQSLVAKKMQYYDTGLLRDIESEIASDVTGPEPSKEGAPTVSGNQQPAGETPAVDSSNPPDFSTTNNQVEGIDEADVIKTDGKFIYIAAGGTVKIVKTDKGKMTLADTIKMPVDSKTGQSINISELYIDSGRLVILGSYWKNNLVQPMLDSGSTGTTTGADAIEKSIAIYPPIWSGKSFTYCGIYSVGETGQTELLKELSVEGSLLSSRKNGDTVYITANKYFYSYGPGNPGEIIPMVKDTSASQEYKALPLDKIMCYPESLSPQYLMVAAVDIMKTEEAATVEAILGSGSTIYMNDSNLYVGQTDYSNTSGEMTAITKFSVNGTKIGFAGGGKVKGSLLNQFSMDEYNGNLRVATTAWGQGSTNSVYILDTNLNEIGALENLAPGERIFAVRFMGNKGYIVTFRQVDPLFVIDLTVPTAPKVAGELKVPGFSNFLYPIGENLLLGVGQGTEDIYSRDSSGKEIVVGTRQTGIKFSIFDVADQGKPKELHTYTVGESGSYSEILYNHKALMLDLKDGILAFDASVMNSDSIKSLGMTDYFTGAVVLTYTLQNGFNEKGRIAYKTALQDGSDSNYYSNIRRLCYIGNVMYYIQDNQIRSFNLDTLQPIGVL